MITAASLGLDNTQLGWAQKIVAHIKGMNLPADQGPRAADIALATCLVESGLRMYANSNNSASLKLPHDAVGSDHGSVGLYQQQVGGAANSTANWGTTAQCMDVNYSTGKFVSTLLGKNWLNLTNGAAAQAVQGSAFPDRYAAQDSKAIAIRTALWGGTVAPVAKPPAKPAAPVAKPAPKPASASTYRVQASDSDGLIALCKRHGISNWQAIARANGISAPNYQIQVGQVLKLTGAAKPAAARTYTVRDNDNLTAIANAHGTTWQKLAALNHLANPNMIYPGQILRLA